MPLRKDHSAELRIAVLRGVYEQNQRISEECREVPPIRTQLAGGRRRWIFFVVLLTAVSFLPDFGSSLSREEGFPPIVVSPVTQSNVSPLISVFEDDWSPSSTSSSSLSLTKINALSQVLGLNSVELDEKKTIDYSLLLSDDTIRLTSIFGLAINTIIIDPGHGGRDPGAIGASGTEEKEIALDIALRLRDRLRKTGNYHILLTRDTDKAVSLAKRVEFANADKADLFISVHINSLPNRASNVIETYYFGPPSDPETLQLAEEENKGSEYPIGDFKVIIQKLGDTLKHQESATLAALIQNSLFSNIREFDADVIDVGVKVAPFVVLLGVDAPSVLAEISCITKEEEEAKLRLPDYREKIASFLEEGITTYLNGRHIQVRRGDEHEPKIDG